MTTLTKTFLVVAAYLLAIALVYWFITYEDAGSLLLVGAAVMLAIVAVYLIRRGAFASGEATPEDDAEADVRHAAGSVVGSFPFSSAWPVVLVGGFVVLALGVLYTPILLPVGVVVAAVAVAGLMRESRA
jgi:hypothetical protein